MVCTGLCVPWEGEGAGVSQAGWPCPPEGIQKAVSAAHFTM